MRVEMRVRGERGAIAILAGVLALALFTCAAFTVDFGLAYNTKRQLQTGADAAALAAGQYYATQPGNCATLAADAGMLSTARGIAQTYLDKNVTNTSSPMPAPTCNANQQLVVSVTASGSSMMNLGKLVGASGSLALQRNAQATVSPGATGRGVRPYALCDKDSPAPPYPSTVVKVSEPGQAHSGSDCAASQAGGDWWFIDCPGEGNPNVTQTAADLTNGCTNPITIVTPQPTTPTPSTLGAALTAHCSWKTDASSSCLTGDTGNSNLKNSTVYNVWPTLLGKTILLPVFCSDPQCQPDTVNNSGNNATYPVYKIAAVVVCGFHIYDKTSGDSQTGDCSGNTFTAADAAAGGGSQVFFYFKYVQVLTSGDEQVTYCALDAACDGGTRQVMLTK